MAYVTRYKLQLVKEGSTSYKTAPQISSPKDIYDFVLREVPIADSPSEEVWIILLDNKNRVIGTHQLSVGGLATTIIDHAKVFQVALLVNSARFIMVHNHPSGDPEPSPQDHDVTRKIQKAGDLIGVQLLDHIVIGEDSFVSIREAGGFQ